jgi:hypothetical protein
VQDLVADVAAMALVQLGQPVLDVSAQGLEPGAMRAAYEELLAAEGRAAAARVRAAAVRDTEIAAMAARFRPGPPRPRPDAGPTPAPAPPAIGRPAGDDDSAVAEVRRSA